MKSFSAMLAFPVACLLSCAWALAAETPRPPGIAEIRALVRLSCLDCHDESGAEGGLDLASLPWEPEDPQNRNRWIRVHDRVMLLVSNNLGVLPGPYFSDQPGADYTLSPYLSELAEFRDDFTVFSGLSHPDVAGGHSTENCFLTAARHPTRSGFRNTISLDQFAAEALGPVTRFPTLNLGVNIDKANRSLSWTRDGILLPAEDSAQSLFEKMFLQGQPADVARQLHRIEQRGSILDTLREDA